MKMVDFRTWGIEPSYRSALGELLRSPDDALLEVKNKLDREAPPGGAAYRDVWVIGEGETRAVGAPATLHLEDGTTKPAGSYLPRDLPLGYHELSDLETGAKTRLVVSPLRCHLPDDLRTWGWAVQLYAVRSKKSWGMGDLGDLRRLARWSARELAAGMMLVNPLHAPHPTLPQQPSPYYPSSRLFRNPLYLAVQEVEGARALGAELGPLAKAGIALNKTPRIERDAIFDLKMRALSKLFARFRGSRAFDAFRAAEAPFLESYATFAVLAEKHGSDWRRWPPEYSSPRGPAVQQFRAAHEERARFHEWLQWQVDEQIRRAGSELPLVGDLAVGVDPGGADAWLWQDLFAPGMKVGAPPDEFNTLGQDWGLAPLDPIRLKGAGYEPLVRIVRSAMRHMGGVRLDHVMALFRLFWIPEGRKPADGVYVRYPALDLLGIVALESVRAGAYVVGEDLGTVEDEVRSELHFRQMLSYRVMWFETKTEKYPRRAVASVTTHDLPTIAGVWSGSDVVVQKALNLAPNEEGAKAMQRALAKWTGLRRGAPIDDVVAKTHAALARAPSALVTPTLDDALSAKDRPNMPGTVTEYPCWCIPLPRTLEEIEKDPRPRRIAKVLSRRNAKSR